MSASPEWRNVRGSLELAHRARTVAASDSTPLDLKSTVVATMDQCAASIRDALDGLGICVLDESAMYAVVVGMEILTAWHAHFEAGHGFRPDPRLMLEFALAGMSEYLPKP